MKKEYKKGDLTVTWEASKCIHSGICARGLSDVFQPKARPWIALDNASIETITAQVDQCPSGALGYYLDNVAAEKEEVVIDEKPPAVLVEVLSNGPLKISGGLHIKNHTGEETDKEVAFLCRCGHSKNKPYCDGSHKGQGFVG